MLKLLLFFFVFAVIFGLYGIYDLQINVLNLF